MNNHKHLWTWIDTSKLFEPPHDKTNKITFAPSKDSDQPGYPTSLIRVFAIRIKKHWVLSYPLSALRRLWSDWADAQADPSSLGAQATLLVLSCGGSFLLSLSLRIRQTFISDHVFLWQEHIPCWPRVLISTFCPCWSLRWLPRYFSFLVLKQTTLSVTAVMTLNCLFSWYQQTNRLGIWWKTVWFFMSP